MKRILILEREYGCGAGKVAEEAARQLGWALYDSELTKEIARAARIAPEACVDREERLDSWLYRLGKSFWRGSYERSLSVDAGEVLDADGMLEVIGRVVTGIVEKGPCVIVGRGAPYLLRRRSDTFSVFLYAPRSHKVDRVSELTGSREEAERLVDTVDEERAAFIKHYYGKAWPDRHLYHLMVNTVVGIGATVELILKAMANAQERDTRVDIES